MITKESENQSPQSRGGRRRRLRTIANVRAFVSHVLREIEADRIEADRGRAILFGAKILADLIVKTDLEARMARLEASGAQGVVHAELSSALVRLKQALSPEQYEAALRALAEDVGEGVDQ